MGVAILLLSLLKFFRLLADPVAILDVSVKDSHFVGPIISLQDK